MIADLRPGGRAYQNLAGALLQTRGEVEPGDVDVLAGFLARGPRGVASWCTDGNLRPGANLLLLVDQFEELFRYGEYAGRETAEAFVALLLESAATREAPIYVVLTMRSEFLGACSLIPNLAGRINEGLYLTSRMDREQCRLAIEGPAGVIGFDIEPALVNRLLNDMSAFAPWEDDPGADQLQRLSRRADQLPLMQHVLNRLWLRASGRGGPVTLRLEEYTALGGLEGALDEHGEEILDGLGSDLARKTEQIFRTLITGETLATAVRRPSPFGELVDQVEGDREGAARILAAFRAEDCNFLQPDLGTRLDDGVIVDISHESLIRQWTPLSSWLAKETTADAYWRRLSAGAARHAAGQGDLLHGLDLANSVAWWVEEQPTAAWSARHGGGFDAVAAYLAVSQSEAALRADAEANRNRRERNRLRAGVAALALLSAVAGGTAVWALVEKKTADVAAMTAADSEKRERDARANESSARDLAVRRAKEAELARIKAESAEKRAKSAELQATKDKNDALRSKAIAVLKARAAKLAEENAKTQAQKAETALGNLQTQTRRTEEASEQARTERERGQKLSRLAMKLNRKEPLTKDEMALLAEAARNMAKQAAKDNPDGEAPEQGQIAEKPQQSLGRLSDSDRAGALTALNEKTQSQLRTEALQRLSPLARIYQAARLSASGPADWLTAVETGLDYAWALTDLQDLAPADAVIASIRSSVAGRNGDGTALLSAKAQLAYLESYRAAKVEDGDVDKNKIAETRILLDQIGSRTDLSAHTLVLGFRARRYDASDPAIATDMDRRRRLIDEACGFADRLEGLSANDALARRYRVRCLTERADLAGDKGAVDKVGAAQAQVYREQALALVQAGLRDRPNDPVLLHTRIDVQVALARALDDGKNADRLKTLKRAIGQDLAKLLGTPAFETDMSSLRTAYDRAVEAEFSNTTEQLAYLTTLFERTSGISSAYPTSQPVAFMAGDSALRIGKLFQASKDLAGAERFFTSAIAAFDRSRLMGPKQTFPKDGDTDDYATICSAFGARLQVRVEKEDLDGARADKARLGEACRRALDAYPWDFYLRQHLTGASMRLGELLYSKGRYAEAGPELQYASDWGVGSSSRQLGAMYIEGKGVAKDVKRGVDLKSLAERQSMKRFTVPTDFGGVKFPFEVYVMERPAAVAMNMFGIDDQVTWVKEMRGGTIPTDVVESFRKLHKIALENNVSLPDLAVYALGAAQADEGEQSPQRASSELLKTIRREMKTSGFVRNREINSDKGAVAIGGYDPVAYVGKDKAVVGLAANYALSNGAVWLFESPANRATFLADPKRYLPAYGGFAADGMAKGVKIDAWVDRWLNTEGHLFFFDGAKAASEWKAGGRVLISKADASWAKLRDQKVEFEAMTPLGKQLVAPEATAETKKPPARPPPPPAASRPAAAD